VKVGEEAQWLLHLIVHPREIEPQGEGNPPDEGNPDEGNPPDTGNPPARGEGNPMDTGTPKAESSGESSGSPSKKMKFRFARVMRDSYTY
jgi:hypothetical protein